MKSEQLANLRRSLEALGRLLNAETERGQCCEARF